MLGLARDVQERSTRAKCLAADFHLERANSGLAKVVLQLRVDLRVYQRIPLDKDGRASVGLPGPPPATKSRVVDAAVVCIFLFGLDVGLDHVGSRFLAFTC